VCSASGSVGGRDPSTWAGDFPGSDCARRKSTQNKLAMTKEVDLSIEEETSESMPCPTPITRSWGAYNCSIL